MMKINLLRIVPFFMVFITLFLNTINASAIKEIKAELVSGGHLIGQLQVSAALRFNGKMIPTDETGYFQLGFSRELAGLHEIEVITPDQPISYYPIWIDVREFNVQRVNGVDQAKVTPPKSLQARIEREYFLVKAAKEKQTSIAAWREESFVWPIFGRITGVYGSQRFYNGIPGSPHWGVDMAARQGTPIYAPASGLVTLAENDLYFSGGTVILDHGNGLTSSFLHLSKLNVEPGLYLKQGEILGFVGSTGRSTGPHLDWRMNLGDTRIDAQLWVPNMDSLCVFSTKACPTPKNISQQEELQWLHNRKAFLARSLSGS
ncbi:M23 family metallopeptidase [Reinekea sp.]|jgi:murein DD-endopeptidase MepM/ murein hydrolase activator NlpD|uniref:M23 family metallopeptidase n=1 Tax=Reinekea sp. TaxID=1970455 RepID=UPI003988AE50